MLDVEQRFQMHELVRLLLRDGAGGGEGAVRQPNGQPNSNRSRRARQPVLGLGTFQQRCDSMLRKVPNVKEGKFAKRTHIFDPVWDLQA